jgi:PAS domain S-box-containing protein
MKNRQITALIACGAADARAALRKALSLDPEARYRVIEAESGAGALESCRTRIPDCLILDLELPDLSGLEVLKKLVGGEDPPTCAVVVLIGAEDARLAVEAMNEGAHDCLERSHAAGEELGRVVRRAMEKSERRRRDAAREHELADKVRALETRLAELRRGVTNREPAEKSLRAAMAQGKAGERTPFRPEDRPPEWGEDRLRLIETALEQSNESVIVTTAQLDLPGPQIVYVNSAFTRMTGYEAGEVVGKTPRILQGPKTDRAVLARLREDCAAGRVFHGETVNYRKDGSEFCLEWSVGPVRDDRGKVTSFIATQRDVTERRRGEAPRRHRQFRRDHFRQRPLGPLPQR